MPVPQAHPALHSRTLRGFLVVLALLFGVGPAAESQVLPAGGGERLDQRPAAGEGEVAGGAPVSYTHLTLPTSDLV